ncbi:hypothetical protein BDD43_5151 [Mucilaginibacter gracilis]|uniref:Uncharacterized protein n=1 Tax=Mucilaginibacter gracilis TaxID=423350 RepID=A0A495J8V1_9SPHI|nr:hypothetical protein [Mucilaginibacter gracilis]RKR84898.1 hypothetical protein BDD43_5151 [Mucilaginibacter gracilis]
MIKTTLQTLAAGQSSIASFFYGTDYEANIQADDAAFPMLHVQTITNSGAELSATTGAARKTWPLFLFFCQKGDIDLTTDEQDAIAEQMKDLAIEYVARLNKTRQFDEVSKIQFKHLYYKFDMCVCGVLTMITLRDRSGYAVCV